MSERIKAEAVFIGAREAEPGAHVMMVVTPFGTTEYTVTREQIAAIITRCIAAILPSAAI